MSGRSVRAAQHAIILDNLVALCREYTATPMFMVLGIAYELAYTVANNQTLQLHCEIHGRGELSFECDVSYTREIVFGMFAHLSRANGGTLPDELKDKDAFGEFAIEE